MNTKRQVTIASVTLFFALVLWATAGVWLGSSDALANPWRWLPPLVAALLLAAVQSIMMLLVRDWRWLVGTSLLIGISSLLILPFHGLWAAALIFMLLLHGEAARRIHSDADDHVQLNIRRILTGGTKMIILGLILLTSIGFFLHPDVRAHSAESNIPVSVVGNIREAVRGITERIYPDIPNFLLDAQERRVFGEITGWLNGRSETVAQVILVSQALLLFILLFAVRSVLAFIATLFAIGALRLLFRMRYIAIEEHQVSVRRITPLG